MLLRIMNHLPSGTDSPERFQISVLYRISLMVSIGILHKFNPSIFNSTTVIPDVSGTFWHLAPRAVACDNLHLRASAHLWHFSAFLCNGEFLGISCYIKKTAAHAHNTCSAAILSYYIHDILWAHARILSLLRSPRYQSAECQKRQYIRNNHKPVKEVCQGPYKFQLQAGTDHDADNDDQGVKL